MRQKMAGRTGFAGMARLGQALVVMALVAGCVAPQGYGVPVAPVTPAAPVSRPAALPDTASFAAIVARVEPVAVRYCQSLRRVQSCAFRIVIDDRPNQPVNASQSVDSLGRPVLAFTTALIREARNADELAFVIGHEAAHHIAGHIPQQQENAMAGAILAGMIAYTAGATPQDLDAAQRVGATLAARRYSKDFELEADSLGAVIAWDAGFDPERGAAFFDRLPDPGDQFLGTHPANSARKAAVARTVAQLRAGNRGL